MARKDTPTREDVLDRAKEANSELVAAKELTADILQKTQAAGDELSNGVKEIRRLVRELRAEKDDINSLRCEKAVAFARVDEFVKGMAHPIDLGRFTRGPKDYEAPLHGGANSIAFLMAFLGPSLAEAMKAEAAKLYDGVDGITDADRKARLAELDARQLELEKAEEGIIRAADRAGFYISRRSSADPRAVLAPDAELA